MGSGDIEVRDKARTLKLINIRNREHIDKTKHAIGTKKIQHVLVSNCLL